jgi:PqqD family protein of HPr-rel-A system
MTARWHICGPLQWRNWGEDWAVYCDASGDTMRLNELAAAALQHLQNQPSDLAALCAASAAALGVRDDGAHRLAIGGFLQRLAETGLVECRPA